MMRPDLTVILIEDSEKDPRMTERFLFAMRELNAEAMPRIQLVAISQRDNSRLPWLLESLPCESVFVEADHPRADDGYPIWDICDEVRMAWPLVAGEYVTFAHAEFLYGPGRLLRTCEWLQQHGPLVAMGNLRRLGVDCPHWKNRLLSPETGLGDIVAAWADAGNTRALCAAWDDIPTTHWSHWLAAPRNDGRIDEDVFYARADWIEAARLFEVDDRQPYQDVYDLIRTADLILAGRDLQPECPRMGRQTNEVIHIDHPRHRPAYSLACYRWFLLHRDQWQGTAYADDACWSAILSPHATDRQRHKAISEFRHGPGGTVTRWAIAFAEYLRSGGSERVAACTDARQSKEVAA